MKYRIPHVGPFDSASISQKVESSVHLNTVPANARVARRGKLSCRHFCASRRAGVRGPQCATDERVAGLERLFWKTRNRISKSHVCRKSRKTSDHALRDAHEVSEFTPVRPLHRIAVFSPLQVRYFVPGVYAGPLCFYTIPFFLCSPCLRPLGALLRPAR